LKSLNLAPKTYSSTSDHIKGFIAFFMLAATEM